MRVEEQLQRGLAAHQAGALDDAERYYRGVLSAQPHSFPAAHLLGMLFLQRRNATEAEKFLALAASINPHDAATQQNHAAALKILDRPAEALAAVERALVLKPGQLQALILRAEILYLLDRFADALAAFDQALSQQSGVAEAHHGRANCLRMLSRFDEAQVAYQRTLELAPRMLEALCDSASLGLLQGRAGICLRLCEQALAIQGDCLPALKSKALALQNLGRTQDALKAWQSILAVTPADISALVDMAYAHMHLGQYGEALVAFDKARALNLDAPYLAGARLFAKMSLCDWSDHARDCAEVLARTTRGERTGPPFYLLNIPSTPEMQLEAARLFTADQIRQVGDRPRISVHEHRTLRVGYLSSDLRNHAVAMLMADIFALHDRDRFEVFGLSLAGSDGSELREQLEKSFDHFISLENDSDPEAAEKIRALGIDILVDLNGHTKGARTGILARRAAPLQINFLGYPGTMGADFIDYIITDRSLVPQEDEKFYAEKIAALPRCFQPNSERVAADTPSRAQCGLPEKGLVLCSFNHSYKITPDIFDIWMRLLRHSPDAVLWLKDNGAAVRTNLAREAVARGVAASRLIFAPQTPAIADHLARHRLADLFLDTLPYTAHTTASDALWCGVPLLTCKGETYAARVSASLLTTLDMPELITGSLTEYEARALQLMRDSDFLARQKLKLSNARQGNALFDAENFTRDLERAFADMVRRSQTQADGRVP